MGFFNQWFVKKIAKEKNKLEEKNILKKALGTLIHLSDYRGKNRIEKNSEKSVYFQQKSEELKDIIIHNWDDLICLKLKLSIFQKSLKN